MSRPPLPDQVVAWDPGLPGVTEVLHARWRDHAYPSHTHDTWALLIVDDGAIGYALDRTQDHDAAGAAVTLLPPFVPHDGRPLTEDGFRKRVIYLDQSALPIALIGRAVDGPRLDDARLRGQVSRLDRALASGDRPAAESLLALATERLTWHLRGRPERRTAWSGRAVNRLARLAREAFDADPAGAPSVTTVATQLGVSTPHLVRAFTRAYGIPPHRYLVGRRLDAARRLLLAGRPAGAVAVECGFYDQAHLSRHFRALLDTAPGRYAASATAGR